MTLNGHRAQINGSPSRVSAARNGPPRRRDHWSLLPDDELLQLRICDLGLRIQGTVLARRIARLYAELAFRGLRFRPHCWLAEEWFSPDGVPGIAIPFYLAHPRLARLERKQMREVEGGTEDWCLRILRHEAGHAIDTAYRLRRDKHWQQVFGDASQPYPDSYEPRPYSRSYVLNLQQWYAQSHPVEDFAETFAVWLKPWSRWRSRYGQWPALKKLQYVEQLMERLRTCKPPVTSREIIDPASAVRKTLATYYAQRRARYGLESNDAFDRTLRRLFSSASRYADRPSAAAFLQAHRHDLIRAVADSTGQYRYTVGQLLQEMIARCRELDLRLDRPVRQTRRDAQDVLIAQTARYVRDGLHRVTL